MVQSTKATSGLLGRADKMARQTKTRGGKMAANIRKDATTAKRDIQSNLSSSEGSKNAILTLCLIGFYFGTSISLTFYQNRLLKEVHFPMTIVCLHFVLKFLLAYLSRLGYTLYTGIKRVQLEWKEFLGKVGLVAVVASLDIALSNWSFEYLQVALYTVTKSTSIIFIAFFAILLGLEKKHWTLPVIVGMIAAGLVMFTYKSTDFSIIGFSMVLSASFLSGVRWTMSQLIMQRSNLGLSNPVDMIYHVQPIMVITLFPFALAFESSRIVELIGQVNESNLDVASIYVVKILIGGVLAFFMETSEFMLLSQTSSLTLAISSILKEILTMSLAVMYQSTDLSTINLVGLVVCLVGIALHTFKKATEKDERKSDRFRSSRGEYSLPLLSESDEDSEEELYRTTKLVSRRREISDDGLLTDNRQWTSVRDNHIKKITEIDDLPNIPVSSRFDMDDSVPLNDGWPGEEDNQDALEEADKLLKQLDLLSD